MTIGIIGAMDEEIAYLQRHLQVKNKHTIANSIFIEGILSNQDVILVKSGIGKVNAAMTTSILMERYKPEKIINTGSAGGFSNELEVGDIVISDKVVHYDVDVTGFNYEWGQVPGLPPMFIADRYLIKEVKQVLDSFYINTKIGLIATGDSFMNNPKRIQDVQNTFPDMLAMEMEAAAIAQVCYQYNVPFVVIRALSDIAGKEAPNTFNAFLKQAAGNASSLILQLLQNEST